MKTKRSSFLLAFILSALVVGAQSFTEGDTIFKIPFPTIYNELQMASGDLNNDGYLDVVTNFLDTNNQRITCILYSKGNGEFDIDTSSIVGMLKGDTKILDLNRDNQSDLLNYGLTLSGFASGRCYGYVTNADSTLRHEYTFTGGSIGALDWGDISNSGYIDIAYNGVTATSTPWDQGIRYIGNKDGYSKVNLPVKLHEGAFSVADIDNDQDLDMYISGYRYGAGGDRPIRVYLQEDGLWTENSFNDVSYPKLNMTVRDIDNNGFLDFVGLDGISIVRMNNENELEHQSVLSGGSSDLGDFDNDGDLDVLMLGSSGGIYRNIGSLEFSKITGIQFPGFDGRAKWIDYDNDGDQDIIMNLKFDDGYYRVLAYENLLAVPNELPSAPINPHATMAADTIYFSWDPGSDFETPELALGYNIYLRRMNEIFMSPMADLATGHRKSNHVGNVGLNKGWHISGLGYGTFYWGVQTLDQQFAGSEFTNGNPIVIPDFELSSKENCMGDILRLNYIGDLNSEWDYRWDFDGAEILAGGGAGPYNLAWNSVGAKTLKLEIFRNDTLIRETSDTVLVFNVPTSDFQISDQTGIGENATLTYLGNSSGGTFNWNTAGANETISGPGPHEISWNSIGKKVISLEVINGSGCASIVFKDTIMVSLIADFQVVDTVCQDQIAEILFTGIGGEGSDYIWEFDDGNLINGNGEGPFQVQWDIPGEKHLSLRIINGITESIAHYDTIHVMALPEFSIGPDILSCYGEKLTFTPPGEFDNTYQFYWNNDYQSKEYDHWAMKDTMIILSIMSNSGCYYSDSISLIVSNPFEKEEICIVTVNEEGKNLIVWEPTGEKGIQQYNVYREMNQASVYSMIGYVPVGALTAFVDQTSDPTASSNRYKIAAVDTCGNESDQSPFHKTIHLAVSPAIPSGYNLSWDHIEIEGSSNEYSSYFIYRGESYENLELIQTIPSSNNQYTDLAAPDGDVFYQISAIKLDACIPSVASKKSTQETFGESFSNKEDISNTIVNERESDVGLHIYPNPFSEWAIVEFENPDNIPHIIKITDLSGKVIREEKVTGEKIEIRKNNMTPGTYILELKGEFTKRAIFMVL